MSFKLIPIGDFIVKAHAVEELSDRVMWDEIVQMLKKTGKTGPSDVYLEGF